MEKVFLKKKLEKKGVSPVVATVLLIAMVLVIALIIFLWFRGLTEESITKFGGQNIKIVCGDVVFSASYSSVTGNLFISNTGNVPIYGMKVKISQTGSHNTFDLKRDLSDNWPASGLRQGMAFSSQDVSSYFSGANEVLLIPVLVGTSSSGEKTYVCEEQYGQKVI